MKKYKKIAYIFLLLIVTLLSLTIYANASKEDRESKKEKNVSEIEFLENKLVKLFNEMNNIETRNYDISANQISNEAKNQENSVSKKEESTQSSGDSGGGSEKKSTSINNSSDEGTETSQKFDLVEKGILTNSEEVNWKDVKNEIEILYSTIPTITLDLYQSNINREDILMFNKEFDNLTVTVKEEKKEDTLNELSKLYEYIPKFMQNSEDEINKIVIETKSNILKAYSKLDSKNWQEISKDVKQAIDVYSKLLTNTNIDSNKQYNISKIYVMINELQNAVQIKDESVFLIKYKNIVEELNSIV